MRPLPKDGWRFFVQNSPLLCIIFLLSACISLGQQDKVAPATYIFEVEAQQETKARTPAATAVIQVGVPRAAPGYDTSLMAYMREPGKLEYYRDHRWANTPSSMLQPLLVKTLEETGAYQAVVMAPTTVKNDMRLETELVRLRQIFSGTGSSRIELVLRLQLIAGDRVTATKLFEKIMETESSDPQGGAGAVNKALNELLPEAAAFCAAHLQSSLTGGTVD